MKKILIISSNRLGDCLLTSGITKYFKDLSPNCHITFVCGPMPATLFKYCKNISELIVLKKRKRSAHWFYLWSLTFFRIWDDVIDLRGSAIGYLLISKRRFIYRDEKNTDDHIVQRISKNFGKKKLAPFIDFNLNLELKKIHLNNIRKLRVKHEIIIIAPSANWIGKIWPIERFSKLIDKLKLSKRFQNPYFVIVGSREEKNKISKLFRINNSLLYDLVGKTSLAEIYLIMKESSLFIGNDSGLMHLAALSGVPTTGLFGPSNPKKYHPWGEETLVIKSPKTYQQLMDYKGFDPKNIGSLMLDIDVNYVLKKIMNFPKEKK